jgi:hypothetical protein
VPEPSAFEVELAIEKLNSHTSPGIDQIPAELMKAGGRTICCEIHKLIINSICNKEELPEEWKELIIVPIYKKGIKTDYIIIVAYHICQLCIKFYPTSCCQGLLHMQTKLLGFISVDFSATGRLLVIYFVFVKSFRRNGNTEKQYISCL